MASRYRVVVDLVSEEDEQYILDWFNTTLKCSASTPRLAETGAEVSVNRISDRERGRVGLRGLNPQFIRPPENPDEQYRVQIPGLPEGTTVAVWNDRSFDPKELARVLAGSEAADEPNAVLSNN